MNSENSQSNLEFNLCVQTSAFHRDISEPEGLADPRVLLICVWGHIQCNWLDPALPPRASQGLTLTQHAPILNL
jgi:hypothetical protein